MTTRCPTILPALVIADDVRLAAQISCRLATPGSYLPVMHGPRLDGAGRIEDFVTANDAAARAKPGVILLAGLPKTSRDAISERSAPRLKALLKQIDRSADVARLHRDDLPLKHPPLQWGRDRIGQGLLTALRNRTSIVFSDNPSPTGDIASKSDHLVVCEDGDELAQIIAANYAFALNAGLRIIPGVDESASEQVLAEFYKRNERQTPNAAALEALTASLRERCGPLPAAVTRSITFVTRRLPYGLAFPNIPSTHLLSGPGLGAAIINGFAAEQPNTHGVSVTVLVDPGITTAPEIAAAKTLLSWPNQFLRSHEGSGANARAVAETIELFPYDLLIIAALCGVVSSDRPTYAFANTDDIARTSVAGATGRSSVLRLYDQDYELAAKPIADHGTPIVINNARFQGDRFAETFMAAGARAYLGPLFPATPTVAQEVIVKLLGKYFGMPLPAALWSAQREIFNGTPHPYIAIGVYPQKLRASDHDIPKYIAARFARALRRWKAALQQLDSHDEQRSRIYQEIIAFYKHELAAIKKRWLSTGGAAKR